MSRLHPASLVGLLALALAAPARAQQPAATAAPGPTGFRADFVKVLAGVEKETVSLEQAMPQDKFGWRPGKGVRSVSEVYLHAAGSVYFFLEKVGHPMPADVKTLRETKNWEAQTVKKDEIQTILTRAFAFARQAALETSDADLDKTIDLFGTQYTQRAIYMVLFGHLREHLGQSIAYARTNGVVPPWSQPEAKK